MVGFFAGRNPVVNSPVEGQVVFPIIYMVLYIDLGWCRISSINSIQGDDDDDEDDDDFLDGVSLRMISNESLNTIIALPMWLKSNFNNSSFWHDKEGASYSLLSPLIRSFF